VGDLRRLFVWDKGENNFYHDFPTMWQIASDSDARTESKSFEEWKSHWATQEIKPSDTGVTWKRKRDWSLKTAAAVLPADLELDGSADTFMDSAARGATDGTAVGADVAAIAKRMGIKPKPVSEAP
jgi:hypothetical protein